MKKWGAIVVGVFFIGGILWWAVAESSKPLPGKAVADQGREHVTKAEWEKFKYNSNPPTSGSHDPVWTRPGIYTVPQGDGHLVHSLEHGYVILNYNCSFESGIRNQESGTSSAQMDPKVWDSKACKDLKKQLEDLAKGKRLWKLIVVPRPNLDSRIAMTAWARIDKFNQFDKERIEQFIDAFRDHGPEQTME